MLPVLLVSVDNTVLAFAIPSISQALAPTGTQQLWIIDVYSLVLAGLLVPMGSLGDRLGRKKLLLIGSTGFAIVSAAAAFAPSAGWLIVARASLGFFGAMLMPSTLSLIRNIFTNSNERRTAIAVWASMFSAGAALGPIVGGFLLEHFAWGAVFLMAVPVLVLFLAVAPVSVPESKDPQPGPIDPLSIVLVMAAMSPIVFAIKHLAEDGFDLLGVVAALVGVVCGWLFVRRQLHRKEPMLDVLLFKNTVFTGAILSNLISIMAMTGFIFFVSQHLQLVSGLTPMRAGIFLLPGLVLTIISGLLVVRLVPRVHPATVVAGSLLVNAAGYAVVILTGNTATDIGLMMAFILLGIGVGAGETIANDLMLASVEPEKAGAASAISETSYEVGAVLGTAVLGGILTAAYQLNVYLPQGLNNEEARVASETLGGATEVAHVRGGNLGAELLESAQHAFDSGVVWTSAISMALMVGAAALAFMMLRSADPHAEPVEH
ncbi:MAG: MFS transporter [Rothia sp. (in: high G+C Gram-positive bacteria)]|nr:MFS transporter [Rothia sp. (in: high G+C Gram-positive bacteria)]